jgi:RimJ/RimL family protein N-acetyltransferase
LQESASIYLMSYLEGPNLVLRPIEVADAPRVAELLQEPEVNRFFVSPPPLALWEAEDYTESFAWEMKRGYALHFAIVPRATGRMAGVADLYHLNRRMKQAEIGIWLGREHWGRGYAAEVNRLLLRLAFEELGLDRVFYRIALDNTRSQRAFEKMGARRVGSCPVYASRHGHDVEHWLYTITREERAGVAQGSELRAQSPTSKL